jgi:conjugation system TraG family ATPase
MTAKKIEDIFPILSVQEDGLITSKNGDLTYAFEIDYPEIFCVATKDYIEAFETIIMACKNIGEGYLIHKQDFFFKENYEPNMSYNVNNDYVIAQNEYNFLDRQIVNHKGYIYLTLPGSDVTQRASTASSLFRNRLVPSRVVQKNTLVEFNERLINFTSTVNKIKNFRLNKLTYDQIVGTKSDTGILNYYFTLSFSDLSIYDITNNNNSLQIAGQEFTTYVINSLDQYPSTLEGLDTYADYNTDAAKMPMSFGNRFGINMQFNHILNSIIYVPIQQSIKNDLTAEAKKQNSFSDWSQDNAYGRDQKLGMLATLTDGSTIVVKTHTNIQLFEKNANELEKNKNAVSAAIQNAGFVSKVATTFSEQIFWSCIPGNAAEIGKDNLATTYVDSAVALWNLESNYKDSVYQNNGLLLTDRFGRPVIVDPFFEPVRKKLIYNRNFTVVGPSGSGKSFTMNNMVYYLLNTGVHVTIIDIGNSYKRLGEIMGAKYVTHEDDNPISLNPFFIPDGAELTEEYKEVLVKLILTLYKKDTDVVSKSDDVTIFSIISEYYKFGAEREEFTYNFNSLFEFIRDEFKSTFATMGGTSKEFDLNTLLYNLTPFYKDGPYDYLLNSADEINYTTENFVIYELDNIKDHPILLPIISLVITNTYVTKLFTVKGVLKMLIIEEAWRATASKFFAEFLLWAFKTARKHFGSIGVVTQEIEDLQKSPVIADAIINNSDIKFILDIRNYESSSEEILDMFKVSRKDIPQILSINKQSNAKRGRFNELAIVLGRQVHVYGVEVSKYAYALFTTEASEVDQILKISEEKDISLMDAAINWADVHM